MVKRFSAAFTALTNSTTATTATPTAMPAARTAASLPALAFRSAALFIILFQIRLIAADLADTSVFTFSLLAGFGAALFLSAFRLKGKQLTAASALASIALIPWVCRTMFAAPRLFVQGAGSAAIILDSLLLNLDRNNFVSLFPFYWSAASTWFSLRASFGGRKFLRAALVADASILLFIFSVARIAKIELYRWPIVMILLFTLVVFLQALSLLFSMPPETKLRIKEKCFAIAALLVIAILGGFFFLKPFQERAVEMGGGLLEPKLFSFDLSQFLRLDPGISTKNDLILIVKKEDDDHVLLRRSVLSGYSKKQGFFRIDEIDERAHPNRLPSYPTTYPFPEIDAARLSKQEYFLVNIDAGAFIGMKEPVAVIPYENWDTSSFNSVYEVESYVSDADYWDLMYTTDIIERPAPEDLGLTKEEYKIYTEYGNDERIRLLAEEIAGEYFSYSEKTAAIFNYLKFGDYRYSLKPGIAPDGDQLGWFLFEAKKGYCSYYAFAFTLLLRSLGIPSRIAAGFYVDPETSVFDYYPVRSDMAHAWVEVAFPDYGWVEYDPTSEKVAEGEEYLRTQGLDLSLFERLMREILENRFRLKITEGDGQEHLDSRLTSFSRAAITLVRNSLRFLLAAAAAALFLFLRCGRFFSVYMTASVRKKSVRLFKHACRRLNLAGLRRGKGLTEAQWAAQIDTSCEGIYSMYQACAAARFAPDYSRQDLKAQIANYKTFCASYKKQVPLWRRLMAWLVPPLTSFIGMGAKTGGGKTLLILIFALSMIGSQVKAQDENDLLDADELFNLASNSYYAENWDKAIELFKNGQVLFPEDSRFSQSLGNLYYSRSLYSLAWDEYRKTESLVSDNPMLFIRLARTAGYLNMNSLSVDYYERALEIDPDNKEAIGGLGWMYFKVHRLKDGENLLLAALDNYGEDPDYSMTLGTIYSDMYKYDESKYWYNKAITLGEEIRDRVFTAIAWYNLSILESNFYQYELCMDATNSSLNALNRASGHIARGDLYMQALELEKAQKDYEAAYETDTSPLAKLHMAEAYQVSGRLEEARLYAEDCLRGSDNSWMMNFGIDPDRYKRDIHEILADTYSGLAETERLTPWAGVGEKFRSLLRRVSYKLKHAVSIRLLRKYCLAAANAYEGKKFGDGDSPHLDLFIQYYNAFKGYPRRAINYLNMARSLETSLIPASIPSYELAEGLLFDDEKLVNQALYKFDPLWKKSSIASCYKQKGTVSAAQELFALNRGALRQEGIKLPIRLNLIIPDEESSSRKHLERALSAAGFSFTNSRFSLRITINGSRQQEYTASLELADSEKEMETLRKTFQLPELNREEIYKLAREIGNAVFTVN